MVLYRPESCWSTLTDLRSDQGLTTLLGGGRGEWMNTRGTIRAALLPLAAGGAPGPSGAGCWSGACNESGRGGNYALLSTLVYSNLVFICGSQNVKCTFSFLQKNSGIELNCHIVFRLAAANQHREELVEEIRRTQNQIQQLEMMKER